MPTKMKEDYYQILGIERTATEVEIKSAFRRQAMKSHPDRNPGNKEAEEQKAAISQSVSERSVDLTSLVSGMKTCSLSIGDNGRAILTADNGNVKVSRELTSAELSRLSATLNDQRLSEETKRLRVAGMVNSIVISQQASQNFEQGMQEQQGRNESMHR